MPKINNEINMNYFSNNFFGFLFLVWINFEYMKKQWESLI